MNLKNFLSLYFKSCFFQLNSNSSKECKNTCKNLDDYVNRLINPNCYHNPEFNLQAPAIIHRHNYPFESYEVKTSDGYIITLFRIPPKDDDFRRGKQAVFLQHALISDSRIWINQHQNSLAFLLADAGYDVWLGNQRESRYSHRHVTLSSSEQKYWDFSMDEVAANDIRASLEEVARVSGRKKSTIYIGYSKGATLGYMFASEYPKEAEELLRGIVALCPAVYLDIQKFIVFIIDMIYSSGISVLFNDKDLTKRLALAQCSLTPHICRKMIDLLGGKSHHFSTENLLLMFSTSPSAESVKSLKHLAQLAKTKRFQKFDHGKAENLKLYGQEQPPFYNLSAVRLPSLIFYGTNDYFVREKSVLRLAKELGNAKTLVFTAPVNNSVEEFQFSHFDIALSKYAKELLFDDLIQIMGEELPLVQNK